MHTEHLRNVRPARVASGWLIAAATTALVGLVFVSLGLLGGEAASGGLWATIAVALGFWTGGFATGFRADGAPILYGIVIGIASLIAWLALNLLVALPLGRAEWEALTPRLTAALLLLQMIAAVAGAWIGYRAALGGVDEREA